ncbi:MAG: hypothetical protein ACK5JO_07745 [Halodesulfovibrio sp.]
MPAARTICGFDMTSAPSRQKPITCATCTLEGNRLTLHSLRGLESLAAFRQALADAQSRFPDQCCDVVHSGDTAESSDGEYGWIAGLDFPFGQAAEFLAEAGWPAEWEAYVRHADSLSREEYAEAIYAVMAKRPKGRKLIRRLTDVVANAISPMSLAYVPVGRMFHALAPIVLESGADVFPLRIRGDSRLLLEAYPALVARAVIGSDSYKEGPAAQRERRAQNRARLVQGLGGYAEQNGGLELDVPHAFAGTMLNDWRGDYLDAFLCAVQVACASRLPDWGMPSEHGDVADGHAGARSKVLECMRQTEGWILGTDLS